MARAVVEVDKVLMICRQWRRRDAVKGLLLTQTPNRSRYSTTVFPPSLSSFQMADGDSEHAMRGRSGEWYLRRRWRAVIPTDAHLSGKLLESLRRCAQSVVLLVADRGQRAYKQQKQMVVERVSFTASAR